MDRKPKPAPYQVGTVLVSRDPGRWFADIKATQPIRWPGQIWTVTEVRPGHQGTLRDLSDEYDDEPVLDRTSDGWNVARAENGQEVRVHWDAVKEGRWEVAAQAEAVPTPTPRPEA